MQVLDLAFNKLNGTIPASLSSLRNIISFSVGGNQLTGTIPPWLSNWKKTTSLLLSNNRFTGSIPPELGDCTSLRTLALDNNNLVGEIPSSLCNALNLDTLSLNENNLSGTLSATFTDCSNLSEIDLSQNRVSGTVPAYLANLPKLAILSLDYNDLSGTLPDELWSSTTLYEIVLSYNRLSGVISRIGNLTGLQYLKLDNNNFSGRIPPEIGKLTDLTVLSLNGNNFMGDIPPEICNCVNLTTLNLGNNSLTGFIPKQIGQLVNLDYLVLADNELSGEIPAEIGNDFRILTLPQSSFVQHHGILDLSNNRLSGKIPPEMGDCAVLVELRLNGNLLTGAIPAELANLTNLTTLDLSSNRLNGSVPAQLGASSLLQGLNLAFNMLSGSVPPELGNLQNLVTMNLSNNFLSGSVPSTLGNLTLLWHIDLSENQLNGSIPAAMSNLVSVVSINLSKNNLSGALVGLFSESSVWHQMRTLNLSYNSLSGSIPSTVGNLSGLSYLDLRGNKLTGAIVAEFGSLAQLNYLDLSENDLSGEFPADLCNLLGLEFLNVSNNMMYGEIPNEGACASFTSSSFLNNMALCGDVIHTVCASTATGEALNPAGILGILVGCIIVMLVVLFVALRLRHLKQQVEACKDLEKAKLKHSSSSNSRSASNPSLDKLKEPLSINVAMFEQPLLRLTLADVLLATNGFCKRNIVGDGGFGTVYKAELPDGRIVAIKKLGQGLSQGNREFLAEMETLGKVKHQNLVPLLGYCSFGEEKLLVYEYMAKGSLDLWLRNRADALEALTWPVRFKIALGSARGLCFLHHAFVPHIIHRDIKASNILLDCEFEPRVSDFGLARLISAYETHVSTDIAGTFGYIPPEYGQSWRATTRGDVYSYGVILLELLTGKEPTRDDFKEIEGGNLVGWVRQMIKKKEAHKILDPELVKEGVGGGWDAKMLRVLHIAHLCTSDDPVRRPTMLQVVKFLKDVEDAVPNLQEDCKSSVDGHVHRSGDDEQEQHILGPDF